MATAAEINEIDDLARLRELAIRGVQAPPVGAAQANAGNRAHLKMDPPSLDNYSNYSVYKKALLVWKMSVAYTDTQQACAVVGLMHDDHKIRKLMKTTFLNATTDEKLRNLTMKDVEDFLEAQLGNNDEQEVYEAFEAFEDITIKVNETYTDFTARFDGAYKVLGQKEPALKYPDKILAMKIRRAAKLPLQTLMNIRANVKWDDGGNVYKDTVKMINRICAGTARQADRVNVVRLATAEGEKVVTLEDGVFMVDGSRMYTLEEREGIYTAEAAGGGRGGGRARGSGRGRGRGGRRPAEETDQCYKCGGTGHFARQCPNKKKDKKKTGDTAEGDSHLVDPYDNYADITVDDSWDTHMVDVGGDVDDITVGNCWIIETEGREYPEVETEDWQMCREETVEDEDSGEAYVYVDRSALTKKTFAAEALGAAGLDSCCSKTIMGPNWFEDYKARIPEGMKKHLEGPFPSEMSFLFGDGGSLNSEAKYILPLEMHGHKARIAVELVKSDIPLLLSKSTMSKCGMVLNLAEMKTTIFGITRSMKETTVGHPIVPVIPRSPEPFLDKGEVLITEVQDMLDKPLEEIFTSTRFLSKEKISLADQKKTVEKIHKQFGHQSPKKMLEFYKQSSFKWNMKELKKQLEHIAETCHGCIIKRKTPNRPAACIPHADGFNQCVGIDLRIEPGPNGGIIMYVIDMWSRLMQGAYVKSKKPEDIIAALMDCWISKYGVFDRTVHDNGGEFIGNAFVEMTDLLGIQDGTTAAHSPWSAGMVEKHHALCDKTLDSLRRDFPTYNKKVLLNWALAIKNSTPGSAGWSPYQVVYQRNPKLPSVLESDLPGLRAEVTSRELMENLNAHEAARIAYNEALVDNQIKKAILSKVRRNQTVFERGDAIFFRTVNNSDKWMQGRVLQVDGKVLFVRKGSNLVRVSTDMAVKSGEEFKKKLADKIELDNKTEQEEKSNFVRPRFYTIDESEDPEGTQEEETPAPPGPPTPPAPPGPAQQPPEQPQEEAQQPAGGPEQESADQPDPDGDDEVFERVQEPAVEQNIIPDGAAVRAMLDTEAAEVIPKRGRKRKSVTTNSVSKQPRILIKRGDELMNRGRVVQVVSRGKATGRNKDHVNVKTADGQVYGFNLNEEAFERVDRNKQNSEQVMITTEESEECLMQIIPYHQHGNQECMQAKKEELDKIVNKFNAVQVVKDEGQFKISSRFVLWYKKHSDGRIQTRARLVARGYEEKDDIPSDSPTLDQTSLKTMLAVARARSWRLATIDIKSAFLQGIPLTDREVRVIPPPEAGVKSGYVWKLNICLYGLQDASLRFYFKVREVMNKLNMKQSKYDPALFIDHDKAGNVRGVVGTHVDDFLLAGGQDWINHIVEKVKEHFEPGKVEQDDFLYCGHRIKQDKDGEIILSQDEFAREVQPLVIKPERKRQSDQAVNETERRQIRSYAGKLGWLGRTTRPDLLFNQIEASSMVTRATVEDLKQLAKAVGKVNQERSYIKVPKLPADAADWTLELFTDAAWQNLKDDGSTAGQVLYISGGQVSYPVYWSVHRLRRVCPSSQTAEIMSLNEGLNDACYIRDLLVELTGQKIQIEATIDNKNAYGAITSNTAPSCKKTRSEAARVREAVLEGEVKRIKLTSGKSQLADVLTKRKTDPKNLLDTVQTGCSVAQLGH